MAWVKYFVIEENWCNGFPDALVGADEKEKEIWDFLKKHEIDYGYKCDQTIPSYVHNGISWYCNQKSAQKVQKSVKSVKKVWKKCKKYKKSVEKV